jgi:hypothetical protein
MTCNKQASFQLCMQAGSYVRDADLAIFERCKAGFRRTDDADTCYCFVREVTGRPAQPRKATSTFCTAIQLM